MPNPMSVVSSINFMPNPMSVVSSNLLAWFLCHSDQNMASSISPFELVAKEVEGRRNAD